MPTSADLARTAYEAYGATTNHLNYRGEPMPVWADLGERIQAAWVAAVGAATLPSDQAVRAVQAWMALDLHVALGLPTDYTGTVEHQGHPSWADWWAELCGTVRTQRAELASLRTAADCG